MSHTHARRGSDGLCGGLLYLSCINRGVSAGELISGIWYYSKIPTTVFFVFCFFLFVRQREMICETIAERDDPSVDKSGAGIIIMMRELS